MTATDYKVRRATTDDLAQLNELWRATLLPAELLEKRFTEFQVVEAKDGTLVGAIGLQIHQKYGNIHSETYLDFGRADTLRPMLWDRLQNVAQNHGLVRLWTQETAPFWKQHGFEAHDETAEKKFPETFGSLDGKWLTLKLKEELESLLSVDKEFELFMQSEKARTQQMFEQAKSLKVLTYLLAIGLLLFVLAASFLVIRQMPRW
ncbi:MAG: hypothetical protein ACK4UN_03950 [Limisphaerales bacterium]